MSKKFKINEQVRIKANGNLGIIKGREVIPIENTNHVKVEYIVKVGNGFANWQSFNKKEIEPISKEGEENRVYSKVYDVVDGYKITIYAKVNNMDNWLFDNNKELRIGYSIYSPEDKYEPSVGLKIARKRSRLSPFCLLRSPFHGEFNEGTVISIMDAKADYIKNHFDNFINRRKK
jgi:hypothetical protein